MNVLVASPGMWVNVTNLNGGPKLSRDLKNSIQYQGEFIMVPHPAEPEKLYSSAHQEGIQLLGIGSYLRAYYTHVLTRKYTANLFTLRNRIVT